VRGWGIEEAAHLPVTWLTAAGIGAFVAAGLVSLLTHRQPTTTSPADTNA